MTIRDYAVRQKDGVTIGDCASRRKDQQALSQSRGFDGFLEKPQGSRPRKDDRYVSVVPRVGRIIAGKKESSGGQKILSEIWTRWA